MDDISAGKLAATAVAAPLHHLSLRLVQGDITTLPAEAYVLGVFDNVNPTGTAKAFDAMLDGRLSQLIQDRVFGSRLGEVFILPTPRQQTLCDSIVFVGLGPLDGFRAQVMELCAENLARIVTASKLMTLTTVPIGTNAGLSVEDAISYFASGFLRGLRRSDPGHDFKELTVCERDPDRFAALEAGARRFIDDGFFAKRQFHVNMSSTQLPEQPPTVPSRRSAVEETRSDPLYLQVGWTKDSQNQCDRYDYSVLTADAGAAIQRFAHIVTQESGHEAGHRLAVAKTIDSDLGQALAKYYVSEPVRDIIETHLAKQPDTHVVVIHDRGSSHIPWEVLHFGDHCPAIEAGMSRKFVTPANRAGGRSNLPSRSLIKMLVIANPTEDLPAAEQEGEMLRELFARNNGDVKMLCRKDATEANVLAEIGSSEYDIVHFAGHAEFVGDHPQDSGLLCADGRLTSADFNTAVLAPQLVFLNGCESGRMRNRGSRGTGPVPDLTQELYGELSRNVSLAELILTNGVSNFIGTYWPVNDEAALKFSQSFYQHLLNGAQLGVALRESRHKIRDLNQRDWANYLHFGSPAYRLRRT